MSNADLDKRFRIYLQHAIAVQQRIQMINPPTSAAWEDAHQEIYRLVELLTGKPCIDAMGR